VSKVVTELAVLEVTPKGLNLERAPEDSRTYYCSTEAELIIEGNIPEMIID
jgi:3-oxoacid CoA-transferase subunit B